MEVSICEKGECERASFARAGILEHAPPIVNDGRIRRNCASDTSGYREDRFDSIEPFLVGLVDGTVEFLGRLPRVGLFGEHLAKRRQVSPVNTVGVLPQR